MKGSSALHSQHLEKALSRREILLGGALLGSAVAAHALVPREPINLLGSAKLESLIPKQIGEWSFYSKAGLVLPPPDQLSDQLYADLLTRVYVSRNRLPIMLLIAHSPEQGGVLQVHRPEVCYPFGGYALSGSRRYTMSIPGGKELHARFFTATKENRIEQLLYWTRIGETFPESWLQQRIAVAEANLRGFVPDAILVRISAISPDASAVVDLAAFSRALLGSMVPAHRKVLVGV